LQVLEKFFETVDRGFIPGKIRSNQHLALVPEGSFWTH
jgi:hypothetical protein